jgi:hypothetical protein
MTVFKGNIFTQNGDKLEERIKMAKKYKSFKFGKLTGRKTKYKDTLLERSERHNLEKSKG